MNRLINKSYLLRLHELSKLKGGKNSNERRNLRKGIKEVYNLTSSELDRDVKLYEHFLTEKEV